MSRLTKSEVVKYQTETLLRMAKTAIISGRAVTLQVKFPAEKNTLNVDTDDQQFNCQWTFTNRQSKTNWQVEFGRQAKEQKQ